MGAVIVRYGGLAMAIAVGLILRFWNLDLKPLWLDETITLLFSLGRTYSDIPREVLLPLPDLLQLLTWQPQSCGAIAQNISQQSTHPPLFFCLMHQWMGYIQGSEHSLRWQVRSLSALFGTGAIAVMYGLNRVAFSHKAGLWAAGLMAASPFAVYLSQEARHYTLPMVVITASLIPLIQLCAAGQSKLSPWLAWIGLNSLGFYVHYFCILAFAAQVMTLVAIFLKQRRSVWGVTDSWYGAISTGTVILSILPWLPTLLDHTQRPETDWLKFDSAFGLHWLEPIGRLLVSCIVTVILLPVEEQSLPITIVNGLLMLGFIGFLVHWLWQRRRGLFQSQQACQSAQVLQYFLLAVGVEYLLLVYILHKDLTLAFRYGFIFYPAFCALLAASVSELSSQVSNTLLQRLFPWSLILVGIVSTGFVVTDNAFAKPFSPQQIAQKLIGARSNTPLVVVKQFRNSQDVALGLSFALAVNQFKPETSNNIDWVFAQSVESAEDSLLIKRTPGRDDSSRPKLFMLWRIGSLHMNVPPMPKRLKIYQTSDQAEASIICLASEVPFSAMGLTYQRYGCRPS